MPTSDHTRLEDRVNRLANDLGALWATTQSLQIRLHAIEDAIQLTQEANHGHDIPIRPAHTGPHRPPRH